MGKYIKNSDHFGETSGPKGLDDVYGHSWANMRIGGHAKVHMGNYNVQQTTDNNFYSGLSAVMHMKLSHDSDAGARITDVSFSLAKLLVTNFETQTMLWIPLQCAVGRATMLLPQQLSSPSVTLENAFGDCKHFELGLIVSWKAFRCVLTEAFYNRPGYQRVSDLQHRLCDRRSPKELVDPKNPPEFAAIFQPGCYLQISIHFGWDEVSRRARPSCGLAQVCYPEKETTCLEASCKFRYRGFVDEQRVEEIYGDSDGNVDAEAHVGVKRPAPTCRGSPFLLKDVPSQFKSITISKKPYSVEREPNGTWRVSRETTVRHGHLYQHLPVEGHARVHMGDIHYHRAEATAPDPTELPTETM